MANTKEYKIVINGISESINAIDSLNKKLENLEQRINTINSTKVSSSAGGTSRTSNVSSLSEEERIQREINKLKEEGQRLDAKIAASQNEIYKRVDATKQLYKEVIADQKSLAAQERLQANTYNTNTMQGMKERLADIKSVINTTDLGDSDKLKKLTQEANELNAKLLEVKKSYGQFGRQVGNYPDAAKNLQAIVVTIGGVEREFNNAREATKTLNNELKAMAVQGKQNTKEYEELRQKILELESTLNDAKKPMDGLMDTMESFTAIASVAKGFGAFFGVDSTEIQRSMQQLLALQTALKGLQTISKQVETREGVGKWIAPFNTSIDKATTKLLVYNRALLGTSRAAKIAAVGVKAFGTALKMAISGGILIAIDLVVEGIMKLVETFKTSKTEAEDFKKVIEEGASAYANAEATLSKYQFKLDNFNGTKKQEKQLVEELNSKLGDSIGHYKSIAQWQDALVKKGAAYANVMRLQALYQAAINQYAAQYVKLATGQAGGQELINNTVYLKKLSEGYLKEIDEISKKYHIFDYSDNIKESGTKNKKAVNDVEKELAQVRISAMKEGLNKTITQLEEERKQRLAKLDKNTKNYKEVEKKINDVYDAKILQATQEWAEKMDKIHYDMWQKINSDTLKNQNKELENLKEFYANNAETIGNEANKFFNQNIGSYGIQAKNQISVETLQTLNVDKSLDVSQTSEDVKKLISLEREFQTASNEFSTLTYKFYAEAKSLTDEDLGRINLEYDKKKNHYDKLEEIYTAYYDELKKKYGEEEVEKRKSLLQEENYSKDLAQLFNQRISAIDAYWYKLAYDNEVQAKQLFEKEFDIIMNSYKNELEESKQHYKELIDAASDAYAKDRSFVEGQVKAKLLSKKDGDKELIAIEKEYSKQVLQIQAQQKQDEENIEKDKNNKIIKLDNDRIQKRKDLNKEYYNSQLQELRDFQTAISNLESKQPVRNEWGITNLAETKKNHKELLASYEAMANRIAKIRESLNKYYKEGVIDKDVYTSSIREVDNFSADLGNKIDDVKEKLTLGDQIGELINDIQQYIQAVGQGLQTIMSAVWSAQDTEFDNESRQLDKLNEKLQTAMDKNEEILEKHKDNVQSIEEELSTARGDRRQHLIDQLNAEMNAERRAAAEKKRLEKEQEALKKKQEKLDQKRQEAQYDRELAQILVSGALAAINAYATKPFVPVGLAMGSLALGITAAQYAIAKAHPPKLANGGLLEGKSHAQGGIKAGGVELEGHEYVINKHTTMDNLDLLEYINSKKKRIDISDLVDFYGGTVKTTIKKMSPSRKYADGGVLPTLNNDYSIDDRLLNAFEDYSNRPVVVSVKEILNTSNKITKVETLAGLTPSSI